MNPLETNKIHPKPSGSILLVEDEPNLAFSLDLNLKAEGYQVTVCMDGDAAEKLIRNAACGFDLYLLDVNLPGRSGFEIAKVIREKNQRAGIIFLTARAAESDSVRGLSLGADDYITKPFRLAELLLKVKRTLARCAMFEAEETVSTGTLIWGPFELDSEKLEIKTPAGQSVLTRLEADMLKEFFLNPDRVLSRQHLLAKVWGVSEGVETRTVDNFVVRLRRLIEANPANPRYLKSIRGRGYVLAP
jgi:DNA-binding response OmpR family regulator